MAVAAGLLGCFVVMRRMALAADSLSHVALPGIGIALALGFHPLFGAAAMLFFGALLIWAMEARSRLATETVIGVVFSSALAIGSLMRSSEELIDALFGGSGALAPIEIVFGFAASAYVIWFVATQKNKLVLTLVSPEIAQTAGVDISRLNLFFLETFALTVALGLRFLGVLLMGSLIIIPAALAKRVTRNLTAMLLCSVAVAVASTWAGTLAAWHFHLLEGPMIITVAAGLFVASLAWRRR